MNKPLRPISHAGCEGEVQLPSLPMGKVDKNPSRCCTIYIIHKAQILRSENPGLEDDQNVLSSVTKLYKPIIAESDPFKRIGRFRFLIRTKSRHFMQLSPVVISWSFFLRKPTLRHDQFFNTVLMTAKSGHEMVSCSWIELRNFQ